MKRYVKELANDRLKSLDGMRSEIKQANIAHIKKVVELCSNGYMTDIEAVEMLIKVVGAKSEI